MFNKLFNLLDVNLHLFDEDTGDQAEIIYTPEHSHQEQSNVAYGTQQDEEQVAQVQVEDRETIYNNFKEQYKDLYSKDFQKHFDNRFKNYKTIEQKANTFEPIITALMKYHDVDNVDALMNIIDDDVYSELANREGLPVEKYKEIMTLQQENEYFKQQQAEAYNEQHTTSLIDSWRTQEAELKTKFPDFSLDTAIDNDKFHSYLTRGDTVEDAYFLAFKDQIIANSRNTAAKAAVENTVANIKARGSRIVENGLSKSPGLVVKSDVSKLTREDREEIAKRAARGEMIKF